MSDAPLPDKPAQPPRTPGPPPKPAPPAPQSKPESSAFDFDDLDKPEIREGPQTPTPPAMRKPTARPPPSAKLPPGAAPGSDRTATPTPPSQRHIPTTGAPTPNFDWAGLGVGGKPPPASPPPQKRGISRDDNIPVVDVDDASPSPTVAMPRPPWTHSTPGSARAPGGPPTPPPGTVRMPAGSPTPGAQRAPGGSPTPGAQRAPGGSPTPHPSPAPGSGVRGIPTPPTQRILSNPQTVTPGNLPKPEEINLEIEDDQTTARRIGITPPPNRVPNARPAPAADEDEAAAPHVPLQIAGESKVLRKEAAKAAIEAGPPPRVGHPSINFDRILIIRLSALGDCVHVLPSFANLRRAFPNAKIAWAVEDRFASLLEGLPGLDQVLVFPRSEFRGLWWKPWLWPSGMLRAMGIAKALRKFAPTVAFDFQGNLKSAMHAKHCKAPAKVGLDDAKEGAEKHYNYRVKIDGNVHRVERSFELLRAAEVPITVQRISPAIPERDRAAIDGWLRHQNAKHTVVCHIGTSKFGAFKRWPLEKWSRVGKLLSRDGARTVLFAWGPGERGMAEEAARGAASEKVVVGPDTPRIGTLAALIARASVVVGCDSGPLHLAAMMNAPVVGIYGPKDPAIYGPWCDKHVVVWKGMPCSPCTKRDCEITDCMDMIEPEEVAQAAEGLLAKIKSPAAMAAGQTDAGKTLWASGEGWEVGKEEVQ